MEKNYLPEQVAVPVKTPGGYKPAPAANHPWRRRQKMDIAAAEARHTHKGGKRFTPPPPVESIDQRTLFSWARLMQNQRPELKMMFHVPNGAVCSESARIALSLEGLRPGVPDVLLPVARGCYFGLAIELKRERGGVLKAEQALWLLGLRRAGWYAVVCKGASDAINTVERYLDRGEFNPAAAPLEYPITDAVAGFFEKRETGGAGM